MTAQVNENELIKKWTVFDTPHNTLRFSQYPASEYLQAMRLAMKEHNKEIEKIKNNPEAPTFENTIVALEASGDMLSNIQYCFYNLLSAETNDELDNIAGEISPEETEHTNVIYQDATLFARVKAIYDKKETLNLSIEEKKLLEDTYESFENMGATLPADKQKEFSELSKQLSSLTLQFQQNVLKSTNEYKLKVADASQLSGLPQAILDAAKEEAKKENFDGYVFTLKAPSYIPFMKYADNRELRKTIYLAYNSRSTSGESSNVEVLRKITETRLKIANLLGYKNHADKILRHRMAEKKENVYNLLDQLLDAYKPTALKEVEAVKDFAASYSTPVSKTDFQPWDWSYYSEKLREKEYSINDEQIKPYLELENVKKGVFGLATRLYGLQFVKNDKIEVYHPEVEAFDVIDKDGKYLAVLYTDFHPREGKSGGAWMTEFKPQWIEKDGTNSRPHISIVMNFSRPTENEPSLLTFDELTTFLHEFGHSIHGMVANSRFASLSGTNVYRDFVELPSQLMENWALEKEYLDSFAKHYKTGEKIPADLIEKIRKAANFNTGYFTLRQLSFGYLDMAWHTLETPYAGDVKQFEEQAWAKTQLLNSVPSALMSANFTHIFSGGYSAGYYGYKWAEVLDADAFAAFQAEGIFNQQTAERFRREVLEKGGSEHPMTLYKRFRGQEPTIDALLKRNGVK
ncbi:MAG: M3 family metallopeptidase [Paludibacteraceae bacterium]|nr:M3 family metallopeptidase [Paludibacteraceae bacterium]